MNYHNWRNAVFNQPIQTLEKADYESEAFTLGLAEALDHIDRALIDDGMYSAKMARQSHSQEHRCRKYLRTNDRFLA